MEEDRLEGYVWDGLRWFEVVWDGLKSFMIKISDEYESYEWQGTFWELDIYLEWRIKVWESWLSKIDINKEKFFDQSLPASKNAKKKEKALSVTAQYTT